MRGAERFASRDLVKVRMPEGDKVMQLGDLSITRARLFGKAPGSEGERIEIELSGVRLAAMIVRVEADAFAVASHGRSRLGPP